MLSVSMLSGYLYCPRKVYLQYALGLSEPPKPSLVLGTLRHKVFERLNGAEEEIVTSIREKAEYEEILEAYKKRYISILEDAARDSIKSIRRFDLTAEDVIEKMMPSVIAEAEERAANVVGFMKKTGLKGIELWERLTPKMISEFNVESSSLGIRGIVDRIEIHDDFMVPVELKTGRAPSEGAWPSHRLQLSAYMLMLGEKKRQVEKGVILYLDSGKRVNIPKNPFTETEVSNVLNRTKELLRSEKPPCFCRNTNKCSSCGLKQQCYDEEFINARIKEVFKASETDIQQKQKI